MPEDERLSKIAFTVQFEGLILQIDNKTTRGGKLAVGIQIDPSRATGDGKVYLTVTTFLDMAKEVERLYREYYQEPDDNHQ